MSDDTEIFNFAAAREKFRPKISSSINERKERQARLATVVDGRTLRSTGRTCQFNFRSKDGLKARAQEAAKAGGITLAEWMERAIEAAIAAQRGA